MKKPRELNHPTDFDDLIAKIKPVGDMPLRLTSLFYGRPGTGKTTLFSTFPKPSLLLDIKEEGTDSIVDVDGVEVLRIEAWEEVENIYWYLKTSKKNKYKCIGIDTVTELQDLAISEWRKQRSLEVSDTLSQRDWGNISGMLKSVLTNYRDLAGSKPIEVVFLSHDRVSREDEESPDQLNPEVGPRLMPSVADHVCAIVKLIGNTYVRERKLKGKKLKRHIEFRLRLGPNPYYNTKIRQPKNQYTPESILDPTYDKLIDIIEGNFKPN